MVSCLGALLTEFAGLAGVGALIGVPAPVTMSLVVGGAAGDGVYRTAISTVERIALAVGAFELVFLVVVLLAQPDPAVIVRRGDRFPSTTGNISIWSPPTSAR